MSLRRCSECSEVSSNISDHVDMEEMKISGLGQFFKAICSKAIRRANLEAMQTKIKEVECELEILFPPAFLDILEHSPIHFVDEIRLGGPNNLHWMYSIERKLCKFNSLVRNPRYPEAL